MKLSSDTSPVEILGAMGKPQDFAIKASKEAFKILSSGLYNNKILAVIRELSVNAWDAHVAAGKKEEPFEVHLPTRLAPTFTVKDNGIGLSHEEVLSLYTTYFATDKSQSNEFVGALGLGSKSPFCYTDGFSVISRYRGTKRYYSCFIGDTGTPQVLLQKEEVTDEPNGLEVSFPVNKEDCWEFENQAKSAFEFFDPPPKTNVDLDINKKDYRFKTSAWGLRSNDHYGKPRAIQGMVPYSVGSIDKSRLNKIQAKLMEMPIDIFFSIGDLAVTASRESLSNDERTIANILKAMDEIGAKFVDQVKEKVTACNSLWEARLLLFSMGNEPNLGAIVNDAIQKGVFDGVYPQFTYQATTSVKMEIKEFDYPNTMISRFKRSWRNRDTAEKTVISSSKKRREEHLKWGNKAEDLTLGFKASENALFIVNDVGFGMDRYVHHFIQRSSDNQTAEGHQMYDTVYFLNRADKDVQAHIVVWEAKKIIAALGNPPVKMVSELRSKYQHELASNKPVYQYVKRDYIYFDLRADVKHERQGNDGTTYKVQGWKDGWKMANPPDPDAIKFYVKIKSLVPQAGDFDYAQEFQTFVKAVLKSDMFDLDEKTFCLYGLNEQSPFLKDDTWVEFMDYVFKTMQSFMTPAKELELSLYINRFDIDNDIDEVLIRVAKTKPLSESSAFQQFAIELDEARQYDANKVAYLMTVLNKAKELKLYEVKNTVNFKEKWKAVLPLYPIMAFVDKPYWTEFDFSNAVIDYLKMVDNAREANMQLTILNKEELEYATESI